MMGLASGIISCVVYIVCYLLILIVGEQGLVLISNLLFHGIDFAEIIRMDISLVESVCGLVLSFLFWSMIGFSISKTYNLLSKK